MEIPADILKTARGIGDTWFGVGHHDSAALAEEIARAIMAERERCARIAMSFDGRTDILKISGQGVAMAILKGERNA